jgi:hypothetical protein
LEFKSVPVFENGQEAFSRNSLNKPLPALPHPYFEYLFADAGISNSKTSSTPTKTAGNTTYAFLKSPKDNSYDFVKRAGVSNPHIDPLKRDCDGFSIPEYPASSYNLQKLESGSIENLGLEDDDGDTSKSTTIKTNFVIY